MAQAVGAEEALERVRGVLGERARDLRLNFGHVDLFCEPRHLVGVMTDLRDDPAIACRYFTFLSAIDWSEFGEGGRGLELLVHVYSPEHVLHVTVHATLGDDLHCPSISDVYSGAIWHERETHEMFGIHFEGHPNLVNLYLPEDFEGHPLRKSFKLPSRALVKDWPGAKDPEEAAAGGR